MAQLMCISATSGADFNGIAQKVMRTCFSDLYADYITGAQFLVGCDMHGAEIFTATAGARIYFIASPLTCHY
jgi:hypothetical protein